MSCPQCQSTEIGSSGKCMVCGYQAKAPDSAPVSEPEAKDGPKLVSIIEMDYSEREPDSLSKEGVPQWRKDLSQRLQEIKQKKDAARAAAPKALPDHNLTPARESQIPSEASPIYFPAKLAEKVPARKPAPKPAIPIPRQKMLQPLGPERGAPKPGLQPADPQEIQKLIDSVVSRQSPAVDKPVEPSGNFNAAHEQITDDEGKWILLSRTLSGLIDLICVFLCTGVFILAAEFRHGIVVLDFIAGVHFGVLLLLIYFIYSFFFLAASNQTIGMMITDLRVVGPNEKRPSFPRLIVRCCCYLVSFLVLGMLWSLFNRKNKCLHDWLSGTTVVRN
jgi:uncharacterized RDD family membrane protein YckC